MKLLGIDYGEKRVGIAISDSDGKIAFPFTILENSKKLSDDIKTICVKESVGGIVIGESLDYNNQENSIMPKVRALKIVLEHETGLKIYFEKEMLTSKEARRAPGKQEKTRKPKKHKAVDASAAAIILQSYIDKQK